MDNKNYFVFTDSIKKMYDLPLENTYRMHNEVVRLLKKHKANYLDFAYEAFTLLKRVPSNYFSVYASKKLIVTAEEVRDIPTYSITIWK